MFLRDDGEFESASEHEDDESIHGDIDQEDSRHHQSNDGPSLMTMRFLRVQIKYRDDL